MKSVLIFDMDGCLLKEDGYWEVNSSVTMELLKKPMPFSFIQQCKNTGMNSNWDITYEFVKSTGKSFEEVVELYQKKKVELNPKQEEQLPAETIRQTLSKLSEKFELVIATGRPLDEALDGVQKTVLSEYFTKECVFTPDQITSGIQSISKVDILNAIKQKIPANKYFYAGDAVSDITSAKTCGFTSIGVYGSLQNRKELEEAGAEFLIESVAELPQCLHQA